MLEIKNLSISVDSRYLIKDLSLYLNAGDKLAIIGEEGNGKSTLLKAIVNQCYYAEITGVIDIKNHKVGYLKQFFSDEELSLPVYDLLFSDQNEYYQKIKRLRYYLEELNIKKTALDLKVKDLSGGERVKIGILKLLTDDCDILLLDEPSNDIDLAALIWLENFISGTDKPIVYISHDEVLLSKTANVILHIEQIKKKQECRHAIIKTGYDDYIRTRSRNLAKQTQLARAEKKEYDKQMSKLTQIKNRVDHELTSIAKSERDMIGQKLKKKMKAVKSQERRYEKQELTQTPDYEEKIDLFFEAVTIPAKKQIIDITIPELYKENHLLARNVVLQVYGNKKIVIVGRNGCGKTTLIKYLHSLLKDRIDIKVGYMPQFYDDILLQFKKPLDYLGPDADKATISKIRNYLGSLNITSEEMLQDIQNLSGGTKAKLFLLKLVIDKCNVLLLDEPTRNLSPLSNPVIRNMLQLFNGTIISVSHDRKYIDEVCEITYELSENGLKEIDKTLLYELYPHSG